MSNRMVTVTNGCYVEYSHIQKWKYDRVLASQASSSVGHSHDAEPGNNTPSDCKRVERMHRESFSKSKNSRDRYHLRSRLTGVDHSYLVLLESSWLDDGVELSCYGIVPACATTISTRRNGKKKVNGVLDGTLVHELCILSSGTAVSVRVDKPACVSGDFQWLGSTIASRERPCVAAAATN